MKILLACEESQAVTIQMRERGIEAYSCDLFPCSGGHPEWHIQEDIFFLLASINFYTQDRNLHFIDRWDAVISFPPCTHLAVSGAKHFELKRADGRQESAIRFFFEMWKISDCTENPIGILNGGDYIKKWFPELHTEMLDFGFPFKSSQIIQPWQYGDTAQKSTCLWLKHLPLLKPTNIVDKGAFYISPQGKKLPAWYGDAVGADGKKLSYNGDEIKKVRSKTFPGIAKAMAEQWPVEIYLKSVL